MGKVHKIWESMGKYIKIQKVLKNYVKVSKVQKVAFFFESVVFFRMFFFKSVLRVFF